MENNQDKFKEVIESLRVKLYETERAELPAHSSTPEQIEGGFVLSIVADKIESFKKTLTKLNGRLKKMKLPELTAEITNPRLLKYGIKGSSIFYDVKVLGVYPKFEGCQFVGKIEHSKEGIQLFIRKEYESRIVRSECEKPFCDYCKTNRDRKATFLIEKDGEIFKVGKSCMDNFVGTNSLQSILAGLSYVTDLEESLGGFYAKQTLAHASAVEVLTSAFAVLDCIGLNENFTRYVYLVNKVPSKEEILNNPHLKSVKVTEAHERMAEEAVKWFIDLNEADNFTMNSKIEILKNGKRQGLIAWGAVKYLEAIGPKVEFVPERKSQKIGEVKQKVLINGIMFRKFADENQWGEFTNFQFRTEAGDIFSWQTGSVGSSHFSEGEEVLLYGTIKGHYKTKGGDYVTMLTRCKLAPKEKSQEGPEEKAN
jgi:hypothetical protein